MNVSVFGWQESRSRSQAVLLMRLTYW